jgi:hypothetical protein
MLDYHPHVHCLVTGGGVSPGGEHWIATRPGFLVPVRVLSRHLRELFHQTLEEKHPELFAKVPAAVWKQDWVVNCLPWGQGEKGVLDYLARYVFRIAITNRRLLEMDEQAVSFRYKDRKRERMQTCRLEGTEFVRRFLQHILPRGFHKVRYYGLWNPRRREQLKRVKVLLQLQQPAPPADPASAPTRKAFGPFVPVCPNCGCELEHVREIPRPPWPRSRSP